MMDQSFEAKLSVAQRVVSMSVMIAVLLALMRRLRVARNRFESVLVVARHQWRASTFFAYLENVITGKKGGESVKALVKRLRNEEWRPEDRVAVFPRLVILFPEWQEEAGDWVHPPGSMGDLNSKSTASLNNSLAVKYSFHQSGSRRRTCKLEYIRVWHQKRSRWIVVIVAENRPLNTLYRETRHEDPGRRVSREVFKVQFDIYREQLEQRLELGRAATDEETPGSRKLAAELEGQWTILHYRDGREVNFGEVVLQELKKHHDFMLS